jgi:hypothetical protein
MEMGWEAGRQIPEKVKIEKGSAAAPGNHGKERSEPMTQDTRFPAGALEEKEDPGAAVLPKAAINREKEKSVWRLKGQMQSDSAAEPHHPVGQNHTSRTEVLSAPSLSDSSSISGAGIPATPKREEPRTVALTEHLREKDRKEITVTPSHARRGSVEQIEDSLSLQTYSSGTIGLYIPSTNAPAPFEKQDQTVNWQLGLSYGGWFGNRTNVLPYYTTEPNENSPSQIYLFPSGDTMHIFFAGSVTDKNWFLSAKKLQFDVHRTTDYGLGFRLGLLYTYNLSDDSRRIHLLPDQPGLFYYVYQGRQSTWTWELGLNYTFNRRKRLQPYLELSGFALVSQNRTYTSTAVFPEQGYEFLEKRYKWVNTRLFYGYCAGLGAQWLLTDHLSIGPKVILARQPGPPMMTIGGSIEARYRW